MPDAIATDLQHPIPSRRRAALVSLGLSVLFLLVYNASNWLASLRSDVGTWYYDWERAIPFVPAMIIPYMSIDLFFIAAPFLCRTHEDLRILSRRIVLAILLAGVIFLLFPLQLAVDRPYASGTIGAVFNWFRQVDLPYNLCPSLHITLRTVLAAHFARHTWGATRLASHIWFSLIGISTLLTYQHHVVDVAGGFILGTVCFYLVRTAPWRMPVQSGGRIGRRYLIGAALLAAVATSIGSWALWLLWPATAMALTAAGYFGFGPGIYGKQSGKLPWSTRIILAPVLIGQYLSLLHYRRQCRAWDPVTDKLWIGRRLSEDEARCAIRQGVTAVIDLTGEFSEASPFRQIRYLPLPVMDLTAPTPEQLAAAVEFIDRESQHGCVYVHCKIGYSRSAAVAGAYLLFSGQARTADAAMAQLRTARPSIVIRPEAEAAIRQFARWLEQSGAKKQGTRLRQSETRSPVP